MEEYTLIEVIEYARVLEENAKKYYFDASKVVELSHAKDFLIELAQEETKHIELLEKLHERLKQGKALPLVKKPVETLGYGDFVPDVQLDERSGYRDILMVGMKREQESVKTYEKFSHYTDDPDAVALFLFLANEEKKHLRKFETAYDDLIDAPY
jgi:rubrerythrin